MQRRRCSWDWAPLAWWRQARARISPCIMKSRRRKAARRRRAVRPVVGGSRGVLECQLRHPGSASLSAGRRICARPAAVAATSGPPWCAPCVKEMPDARRLPTEFSAARAGRCWVWRSTADAGARIPWSKIPLKFLVGAGGIAPALISRGPRATPSRWPALQRRLRYPKGNRFGASWARRLEELARDGACRQSAEPGQPLEAAVRSRDRLRAGQALYFWAAAGISGSKRVKSTLRRSSAFRSIGGTGR